MTRHAFAIALLAVATASFPTVAARAQMPGGAADIALYYRVAPLLLQRINASSRAASEFARIYALYILPSALAASLGCNRLARALYTRMMRARAARHDVALS
jgi:hypothetical protein